MFWIAILAAVFNDVTFLTKGDSNYFLLACLCFLGAAINYTITPEPPSEEEDHE